METLYTPLSIILSLILESKSSSKIQVRHIVNIQKGLTGLVVLFLMWYFQNFNPGCWLYLSLHGSYGLVWLIKDFAFPDQNFNRSVTVISLFLTSAMLLLYWLPILIITSGQGQQFPSPLRAVVCVTLNILGSAVMMAADAQKFFTLAHQKGLITTGMFKYTRSPNFLGEIMIYFSFAHCVGTFEAYFIVVGAFVTVVFTFIVRKEASNRKKKGWEAYQQRSFLLLPKVVPSSSFLSYLIYAGIGISAYILMGE